MKIKITRKFKLPTMPPTGAFMRKTYEIEFAGSAMFIFDTECEVIEE